MLARTAPDRQEAAVESPLPDIEWRVSTAPVPYEDAVATMEARAAAVLAGTAPELVWLLEHPPIYTAGTSADPAELLDPRFPVHKSGRGGKYTYHGPGQRIGYLVLDLNRRGRDIRAYVHALERWVIAALSQIGIDSYPVCDRIGIWTRQGGVEAKIGAIGVRVRKWVTLHGFSVNVAPDLAHFGGIVPCGLPQFPVTSIAALGKPSNFATFDAALALHADAFLRSLGASGENET